MTSSNTTTTAYTVYFVNGEIIYVEEGAITWMS